jgi:hypothetical protein
VLFVSFIAGDLGLSVVPVAILSLLLFILGIAVFPQRATTFILQWPAIASDENLVATIDNTQYPILGYEQELILSVKIRNGLKLLATVVLSAVSLYFVTAGTLSLESELRRPFGALIATFALEFLLYGGAIVLLTNARWCDERRFLKGSHCAIADVISHDNGLRGGGIRYQFFDHNGERRGGYGPFWGNGTDTVVLAFYDPKNPDRNSAHNSFVFHKCNLAGLIPKRDRQIG